MEFLLTPKNMKKNKTGRKNKPGAGRKKLITKEYIHNNLLPKDWEQIVYERSREGWSEAEIRTELSVVDGKFSRNHWDALLEMDKEFLTAINIGRTLCQAWWERQSRENLRSQFFNTGSWYANMKNRFGWRDKHDIDGSMKMDFSLANVLEEAKQLAIKN